jgi:crotonobetainyl-CoA:carnitine CoA-transferase CaiB-like acyl-CoA transferase
MGAEVLKVERPDGGDPARRLGPFPDDMPDTEKSGIFLYLNTNRKGITLNLKTETGKRIFKELVKDADVIVENFEPGVMTSLGLDYEILEKINPGLVMTSISNFGQTGPYRDYKAQEINMVALGGLMYMTGDPDKEPLKEPASTIQFAAGANACAATLAAVYAKKRTGTSQHVDVSILESVASVLDVHTLTWNRSRLVVRRNGNECGARTVPGGAGEGVYPCKDGYIGVVFARADEMALGAALTGIDEFNDPDIGYMSFGRCVDDEKVSRLLVQGVKDREKEELFHSAQQLRLFWSPVFNIEEVINWPHYQERGFWVDIDHPKAGQLTYASLPFTLSESPRQMERAPLLGEHNEEIYCRRLGYSKEDLVKLWETNVI